MITLSFAVSRRFRLTENDLKIKKEEEKQFNEKIKELETNIRKAQMNPHFMFNALTSIEYYILKNNPKEACIYLEEFAQLMRLTLDNSRESYIPLEDELKALKLYIGLEFLRLKEKGHELTFRIDESIDQESIVVPALLIQPFVENAILHGLQKKTESGRLTIDVAFDGNNLQCLIEDNGGGIIKRNQTVKRKSSGIQITKERLTLIHGMLNTTYRFEINDLLDGFHNVIGTRVLFYIPYKKD
jgi:LytS/YehU family sensor histidine kinase